MLKNGGAKQQKLFSNTSLPLLYPFCKKSMNVYSKNKEHVAITSQMSLVECSLNRTALQALNSKLDVTRASNKSERLQCCSQARAINDDEQGESIPGSHSMSFFRDC